MKNETSKNLQLGLFVLAGTIFLILALYLIGKKKELFSSTIHISARFHDVSGLMVGNNVRFDGINVGSVTAIKIQSDSVVIVSMVVEKEIREFIRKNALAKIATEGLMGNKLISILSTATSGPLLEEGDELGSIRPIDTDAVLRTLNSSNQNIEAITGDLRKMTGKINSRNTLWSLLMDTTVSENIKQAIVSFKITGHRSAVITGDIGEIVRGIRSGKGSLGAILTDTVLSKKMEQTIVEVKVVSDKLAIVTGDMSRMADHINSGQGAIGTLLMDTAFVHNLNKSMENIKTGSKGFSEDMEALKHTVFLRKYFRKKARADTIR